MTDAPASYLSETFVEHTVNGRVLRFYPIRLYETFRLRNIAKPLVRAFTILLSGASDHQEQRHYEYDPNDKRPAKEQMPLVSDTTVMAPKLETVQYRDKSRADAAAEITDTLLNEANALIFVRLFMDSLRDEYKPTFTEAQIKAVYDQLDAVSFSQMLVGLAKANANTLGPFAKMVALKAQTLLSEGVAESPKAENPATPAMAG